MAAVYYQKFILFITFSKTKCTRVLGSFFDRVPSTLTFEYEYQPSTWGSEYEYEYEYSKNGTRVVLEYEYCTRVLQHWSARNKQTNMFKASTESEDITKTSYKVSHLLARNMKTYSDGEIMKQAIVTFATECCSSAIQQKAKKLQLSNTTITRRIECISNDQHDQLLEKSKNFECYSVALDSSKDLTDTEQLAVFIRGVMPDFTIYEEYLTLRSIHGSTKGTDIFREFRATLEEAHLDPSKLFGVATDGCSSMLGANRGL